MISYQRMIKKQFKKELKNGEMRCFHCSKVVKYEDCIFKFNECYHKNCAPKIKHSKRKVLGHITNPPKMKMVYDDS